MKIPPLICEHAERREKGRIICTKTEQLCEHAKFRPCVGWWQQLSTADTCEKKK